MQNDFQNTEKLKTEPQTNTEESSVDETKEFALIMKGGGAKGLAYIGAIQVLEKYGYKFTWFVGTSAGAITAVLMATGYSANELETIIKETKFKDFRDVTFFKLLPNIILRQGLFSGDNLKTWLETLLNNKLKLNQDTIPIKLRQLHNENKNRLTIYAATKNVNAKDFDSHSPDTRDTDAAWAVRASASIPYFFTRTYSQDGYVFDGGLSHNYPIDVFLTKYNEDKNLNFLGLYLGKTSTTYNESNSIFSNLLDSWLTGNDKTGLIKYGKQTIVIDPSPITTLRFSLTDTEKEFLIATGKASALDYLSRQEKTKALISENEVKEAKEMVSSLRCEIDVLHKKLRQKRLLKLVLATILFFIFSIFGVSRVQTYFAPHTSNQKAIELYNKAIFKLKADETPAENTKYLNEAIIYFQAAIVEDENYVPAYLGIANAYANAEDRIGSQASINLPLALKFAKEAEEKAKKLGMSDPELVSKIHSTFGVIYYYMRNWKDSKNRFETAISINRYSADTYRAYSKLLRTLGNNVEARKNLEIGLNYDDKSSKLYTNLGMLNLVEENNDAAIKAFDRAIELDGTLGKYGWIAVAYVMQNNIDKAIEFALEDLKKLNNNHDSKAFLAYVYAHKEENRKDAEIIIQELISSYNLANPTATACDIAIAYSGFKDKKMTLFWLNKAVEDNSGVLSTYVVMPQFKFLQNDNEFQNIKYNLMKIPKE